MWVATKVPARNTASLCQVLTGLSIGSLIVCISAGAVDDRYVDGVPNWLKPTKFAASFVILFGTLAWLEAHLSEAWRKGLLLHVTTLVMGVSMVAEMGYLMHQAALAEPSHFNYSTPFHTFMYTVVMFAGALLLVLGIGVFGYAAAKDDAANLTSGLRTGVVWGFALSVALTLIVAVYMGGQSSSLVGTPATDAQTIPVLGWSLEVGDFRPAHFLSLHAMQALPILGWAFERLQTPRPQHLIWIAAALYAALTLGLFVQALHGQPIIALSA